MALANRDTAAARRALTVPDTSKMAAKVQYVAYRRPLAAAAYYALGDYQTALDLLDTFEPDVFASRGFDPRWAILGRVRMLRGDLHAKLGHVNEARQEYRRVLAQWKSARADGEAFGDWAARELVAESAPVS